MGLLNLTTDLKSLRYGKDRIGGGSSREPFVTNSINGSPGDTGGPDFLLRANTLQKTGEDLSRIGQFMISPKGLQFAAKQNVLSRSGVRVQSSSDVSFNPINDGIYLPTSTLAQIAVNAEGGHLLKQGLNPFRNTKPDDAKTGIGFFDSILNAELPLSQPMYAQRVKSNQPPSKNRLTQLVNSKIGVSQSNSNNNPINSFLDQITSSGVGGFFGGLLNNLTKPSSANGLNISQNSNEILRYNGGPGSILGIGQTAIDRVVDSQAYTENENFSKYNYLLNYSNIIGKTGDGIYSTSTPKGTTMVDFRSDLIDAQKDGINKDVLSTSLNYTKANERLGGRVNMGDPGRKGRNLINYNIGVQEGGKSTGPLDKINALPLYSSPQMITDTAVINDLVKFRIGILDNNKEGNYKTYIHFRSFIDSFSDNYSADWKSHQYMGRGESFYSYGGFKRQISMAWTVAALSIDELIPMYQKLNFLASSLAPDYSDQGYMQGNIAYLTMGGYCYEQPGIITGINISPMKESPYEVNLNSTGGIKQGKGDGGKKTKELAMYVNVTGFNFIPLHNFVPRIQQNTYFGAITEGGGGNYISKFGKERFISLQNAVNNNYASNNFTRPQPKEKKSDDNPQINKTEQSQGLNTSTT
jgi:hypothetical protein